MSLNLLLALADSVSCSILQDWLDLKSLVAVDSAFCNKRQRGELLSLLRSDAFTLPKRSIVKKDGVNNYFVPWVIAREIPSQHFVVVGNADTTQIFNYLKHCGAKITSLALHHKHDPDVKLDPIIKHCHNLTYLQINASKCDQQIRNLLLQNSNLVELHLSDDNDDDEMEEESIYKNIKLPNLRVLSCSLANSIAFVDVLQMGNLIKLNIDDLSDSGFDFLAIAQHCPLLRSLGLPYSTIDDTTLIQIAQLCTHIVNLNVEGCDYITDTAILAVTTHLPGLCSLNIMLCPKLTSTSLVHVYKHCAQTLHTLYMKTNDDDVVSDLFAHCTSLHTLFWTSPGFPCYLLPNQPYKLTTLVLAVGCVNDENLRRIGKHYTHLHTLSVCGPNYLLDVEPFTDVVVGCTALQYLYYDNVNVEIQPEWSVINPTLIVSKESNPARLLQFKVLDMPV